jgi:hypothetical protein
MFTHGAGASPHVSHPDLVVTQGGVAAGEKASILLDVAGEAPLPKGVEPVLKRAAIDLRARVAYIRSLHLVAAPGFHPSPDKCCKKFSTMSSAATKKVSNSRQKGMRELKRQWLVRVIDESSLSQRDVAYKLGLSDGVLSGMLNGHRAVSDDTVDQVMELFVAKAPDISDRSPIAVVGEPGPQYGGLNDDLRRLLHQNEINQRLLLQIFDQLRLLVEKLPR